MNDLPDFVCIGTYKAATTWLFDSLKRNPSVFMPDIKEIHFFNEREGYDAYNEKGVSWYTNLYSIAPRGAIRGDITPGYFASSVAAERLRNTMPNAKLILILRDPAERAWSHYWYRNSMGQQKATFDQLLVKENCPDESLIGQGFYSHHLRRWYRWFDRRQLLIIFFEQIERSPVDVYKKVCDFIGADSSYSHNGIVQKSNSSRILKNPSVYKLKHNVARFLYLRGYNKVRRVIKATRIPFLINKINTRSHKNPKMTSETRRRLVGLYKYDILELEKMTGVNLNHWLEVR